MPVGRAALWLGGRPPGLLTADHMEVLDGSFESRPLHEVFGYGPGWMLPAQADADEVLRVLRSQV